MGKLSSPLWVYLIQTFILAISLVFLSACEVNEDEAKKTAVAFGNQLIQAVTSPEVQQLVDKSQQEFNNFLDEAAAGGVAVSQEVINRMLQELDQQLNTKLPQITPIFTPIIQDEINNFVNEFKLLGNPPDNIIEQYIYQAAESAAQAAIIAVVDELALDLNQSEINQIAHLVARVAANKVFMMILEEYPTIKMVLIVQRVMLNFNGQPFEQLVLNTLATLSAPPTNNNLNINQTAVVSNTGDLPLRCRSAPGIEADILIRLSQGTIVSLREGPIHQGSFAWWRVELADKQQCWAAGNWLLAQ